MVQQIVVNIDFIFKSENNIHHTITIYVLKFHQRNFFLSAALDSHSITTSCRIIFCWIYGVHIRLRCWWCRRYERRLWSQLYFGLLQAKSCYLLILYFYQFLDVYFSVVRFASVAIYTCFLHENVRHTVAIKV